MEEGTFAERLLRCNEYIQNVLRCNEYITKENETPTSIGKKVGMKSAEIIALNAQLFPGVSLFSSSKFRKNTYLHIYIQTELWGTPELLGE